MVARRRDRRHRPIALAQAGPLVPDAAAYAHDTGLCDRPDIDAVVVCLPPHLDADAAPPVAGAGMVVHPGDVIAAEGTLAQALCVLQKPA